MKRILLTLLTTATMVEPVSAHHVADIDAATSEYWRGIHGTAWLTCVESYLNQGVDNLQFIHNQCIELSTMNMRMPRPRSPWADFNPFDNPFKDSTIQAPTITF